MRGLKLSVFLLSSFGIGLNKGSIFDILNISQVLKFIDLYLSRQAGKLSSYILRILKSRFVSFSLSVLKFVFLGDGGGYLTGEGGRGGRGGAEAAADRDDGCI